MPPGGMLRLNPHNQSCQLEENMPAITTAHELRALLASHKEFALLDVRDAGNYNSAHIPGASLLPRHRIEYDLPALLPFPGAPLIICDDAEHQAPLAAATAERMGYTRVSVLEGGINRWTSLDFPTEWGTNVPSKDFGERMEVEYGVPEIDSIKLKQRIDSGEKMVIMDTRTPEEFQNFAIPGGRSVPNGELALHVTDILKEHGEDSTVILNCAGRTRSIIGTRALQRMGIPKVYGLKNGTAGWVLAGLELEIGADRLSLPEVSEEGEARAATYAGQAAMEDGVLFMDIDDLEDAVARASRETVYLVDVRREEEYRNGHIPGFRWFPGGQAVQRADDVAPVRNGLIVFTCDGRVRSTLVASWFRQMGFPNVYALQSGVTEWAAKDRQLEEGMPTPQPAGYKDARGKATMVSPQTAASMSDTKKIFVGISAEFAEGHIPGSSWTPRGWLESNIADIAPNKDAPLLVTCTHGVDSVLAARTLSDMGYANVSVLEGGMNAWLQEGLDVEKGLSGVMTPPTDVVVMGPHRSYADTIHYLRWEPELGYKYTPRH